MVLVVVCCRNSVTGLREVNLNDVDGQPMSSRWVCVFAEHLLGIPLAPVYLSWEGMVRVWPS